MIKFIPESTCNGENGMSNFQRRRHVILGMWLESLLLRAKIRKDIKIILSVDRGTETLMLNTEKRSKFAQAVM
jgi:hypothetical protein